LVVIRNYGKNLKAIQFQIQQNNNMNKIPSQAEMDEVFCAFYELSHRYKMIYGVHYKTLTKVLEFWNELGKKYSPEDYLKLCLEHPVDPSKHFVIDQDPM